MPFTHDALQKHFVIVKNIYTNTGEAWNKNNVRYFNIYINT